MFHFGDEDLIAGLDIFFAEGICNKADGVCRAFCKNDLFRFGGIQVFANSFAGIFIQDRYFLAEGVNAPVDIAVLVIVIMDKCIDHLFRFLRGGAIIEIDKSLAVHHSGENGKVFADFWKIKGGTMSGHGFHLISQSFFNEAFYMFTQGIDPDCIDNILCKCKHKK